MHIKKYNNKILLVDDDPKNLQVAMSILKDYNVIYAQSGEKALKLIEKNDFDLILLDIVMPILDGYEVCKRIKSNFKMNDIPIIFLTVKDDEKDIIKGFEYGAVDYIIKPFYSSVLLKRVQLHLNLAQAMTELKDVNNNLNELVDKQVEDIRKKEEILFQQSKISAMSDMIDVISLKWKQPLSMIKLYLQSMDLQTTDENMKESLSKTLGEVSKLDDTMYDFQKFFKNDIEKQNVNIKVLIENVLFLLKDDLVKNKVKTNIQVNHLLELYIVSDELKHVILKLITYSIENICSNNEKCCDISFFTEDEDNNIIIRYIDNVSKLEKTNKMLNLNNSINSSDFDLGFYLMKVFIEKNQGKLNINESSSGIDLSISFNK